jgi:hypothetical protein
MSTVQEIENAICQLSEADRAAIRAWFAEYDAAEWYRKLEADVASGRLNWLAEEARNDLREGRCIDR